MKDSGGYVCGLTDRLYVKTFRRCVVAFAVARSVCFETGFLAVWCFDMVRKYDMIRKKLLLLLFVVAGCCAQVSAQTDGYACDFEDAGELGKVFHQIWSTIISFNIIKYKEGFRKRHRGFYPNGSCRIDCVKRYYRTKRTLAFFWNSRSFPEVSRSCRIC